MGDVFQLTPSMLGQVDAVYDRAALVALSTELRNQYSQLLIKLTQAAPQLLICFEYDQAVMEGPPFSVGESEIERLYGEIYTVQALEQKAVEGGLKGICPALESAWLLSKSL